MKKIFTILFGTTILASSNVKAQAVEQGSKVIEAYVGLGGLEADYLYFRFNKIILGGRFEYMVSDKIGIGVDGHVQKISKYWNDNISDTITGISNNYSYELYRQIIRIMPRVNIHFEWSFSFDGYFGIAAGYRNETRRYTSTDPDYKDDEVILPPFAMRISVGGRYFFTDNIGLNMELGLGGGTVLNGGLIYKIN